MTSNINETLMTKKTYLSYKHIPDSNATQTGGRNFCIFCMWQNLSFHMDQT